MRTPDFWYRPNGGVLAAVLSPVGWAYGCVSTISRAAKRPTHVLPQVICIGNLVAGGAGKTPIAMAIADRLRQHSLDVHFLTRGYGGRAQIPLRVDASQTTVVEGGDEALLLAANGPTWIDADRLRGARAATNQGADVIVMDDGFQNPRLAKDLSILVFDGNDGIGNGRLMPAGPLRETLPSGAARASAAVVLGPDRVGIGSALALYFDDNKPLLKARLEPAPEALNLAGEEVVAFAGIGRPEKFFRTLERLGCQLAAKFPFPDHHQYRAKDLANLHDHANQVGGRLVTTTKDAVRLPANFRAEVTVVEIGVVWQDNAAVDALLAPFITTDVAA